MHDEDAFHPNKSLQQKLQHIFELRRESAGRINFEDNSYYLKLLENIGNPHQGLAPVIHVAGTNGKGSTIAMLKAVLEAEGYKVSAYTSPHLKVFNERIYLSGQNISDADLNNLLDKIFEKNKDNPVTFFEFTTALAFLAFKKFPSDIILLETGMGGRLDCSNIISCPLVTVITPVSFDHMEFLGDTLPKIAAEKAGIMKHKTPCIISAQNEKSVPVFEKKSKELNAPIFCSKKDWYVRRSNDAMLFSWEEEEKEYPLPNLIGSHQIQNAGTALATLEVIKDQFPISEKSKQSGLVNIHWPGRMEQIIQGKYVELLPKDWQLWFDGGHNVAGAKSIVSILKRWKLEDGVSVHILLGMKENKEIDSVKRILEEHSASLIQLSIGEDLTPKIKNIVSQYKGSPQKIIIAGSLYNYS